MEIVSTTKLTPEQKAATVIVALGADKASKIYKHLTEKNDNKNEDKIHIL